MKHFKNDAGDLYAIESGFEYMLPVGLQEIAAEEAELIRVSKLPTPVQKTTLELDIEKYKRRAFAKNDLMAEMAAMNVGRIKDKTWTKVQLVELMADPEIKSLVSHMETLSFELAIGVIQGLTNPIVTPEIKAVWVAKLAAKL